MKSKFYYDDFMLKDHTTVKLIWNVPKELAQNNEGGRMEILRGFIKSDLVIQINNAWGNLKSLSDSFLAGSTGSSASDIINGMGDLVLKSRDAVNAVSNFFGGVGQKNLSELERLANSKAFSFADYIKRYQGTDMAFPNNIDVVFLADEEGKDPRIEARNLLKYIVGGMETDQERVNKEISESSKSFVESLGDLADNIKNAAFEFYNKTNGILVPPGGYRYKTTHDYRNPFDFIEGTLSLVIGRSSEKRDFKKNEVKHSDLVLRNLLVDSAEMVVSKTLTTSGYPLYVTVAIGLSPSSFYSAGNLHVLLGGDGKWDRIDKDQIKKVLDADVYEDAKREYENQYPGRGLPGERTPEEQLEEDIENALLSLSEPSVRNFRRKNHIRDAQVFVGKNGELLSIGMSSATAAENPEAYEIYKDAKNDPILRRPELAQFNKPNSEVLVKFKFHIDTDEELTKSFKNLTINGKKVDVTKDGDRTLSNSEILDKYCKASANHKREDELKQNDFHRIAENVRTQDRKSVSTE